jgi:hypothetical protein
VRLWTEAFAQTPSLGYDLKAGHRFQTACGAAQAATGQGKDASKLDEKERAALRKQAREWLRGELSGWSEMVEKYQERIRGPVRLRLQRWQGEARLAPLREPAALLHLGNEEQTALKKLWADVAALLARVSR